MSNSNAIRLIATAALMTLAVAQQANALSKEQAVENCRNSIGRTLVQACMRGGNGDREACREQAKPKVRACVISALNVANGRANVPVALPKEQVSEETAKQAADLPTNFVAPPRTITDITAILDSEKPDPAKIASLKEAADGAAPSKGSRIELARFYYSRGAARASLGRLKD